MGLPKLEIRGMEWLVRPLAPSSPSSRPNMDIEALQSILAERGEPKFRLSQAKRAFFVDMADSWEGVTVYSKPLREDLAAKLPWDVLKPIRTQEAPNGDTVKTLFACADGQKIEGVLMLH